MKAVDVFLSGGQTITLRKMEDDRAQSLAHDLLLREDPVVARVTMPNSEDVTMINSNAVSAVVVRADD